MGTLYFLALMLLTGSAEPVMHRESVTPFTADYDKVTIIKNPDGSETERRESGRMCRDSRGRMRNDFMGDGAALAVLVDPRSNRVAIIDAASGRSPDPDVGLPNLGLPAVPLGPHAAAQQITEDPSRGSEQFVLVESTNLGDRVLEGLPSRGYRAKLANGSVTETWYANSIEDIPIAWAATGPGGREESHLRNIRLVEPDPELFRALETAPK